MTRRRWLASVAHSMATKPEPRRKTFWRRCYCRPEGQFWLRGRRSSLWDLNDASTTSGIALTSRAADRGSESRCKPEDRSLSGGFPRGIRFVAAKWPYAAVFE